MYKRSLIYVASVAYSLNIKLVNIISDETDFIHSADLWDQYDSRIRPLSYILLNIFIVKSVMKILPKYVKDTRYA